MTVTATRAVPVHVARLDPVLRGVEDDVVAVEVDPERGDLGRTVGVQRGERGQDGALDELAGHGGQDVGHGPISFVLELSPPRVGERIARPCAAPLP